MLSKRRSCNSWVWGERAPSLSTQWSNVSNRIHPRQGRATRDRAQLSGKGRSLPQRTRRCHRQQQESQCRRRLFHQQWVTDDMAETSRRPSLPPCIGLFCAAHADVSMLNCVFDSTYDYSDLLLFAASSSWQLWNNQVPCCRFTQTQWRPEPRRRPQRRRILTQPRTSACWR